MILNSKPYCKKKFKCFFANLADHVQGTAGGASMSGGSEAATGEHSRWKLEEEGIGLLRRRRALFRFFIFADKSWNFIKLTIKKIKYSLKYNK
jgi:hypothetical protein